MYMLTWHILLVKIVYSSSTCMVTVKQHLRYVQCMYNVRIITDSSKELILAIVLIYAVYVIYVIYCCSKMLRMSQQNSSVCL